MIARLTAFTHVTCQLIARVNAIDMRLIKCIMMIPICVYYIIGYRGCILNLVVYVWLVMARGCGGDDDAVGDVWSGIVIC